MTEGQMHQKQASSARQIRVKTVVVVLELVPLQGTKGH